MFANVVSMNLHKEPPRYMKVGEAAAYLGVSRSTLRNWDINGKLQAHRHPVSRYRIYKQSMLDDLLSKLG
ncbi:excisionase family DNA-binding protein [Hymenobacter cavernae]|uniref:Helix-turn-helix domain-containing protein n=1 Tax=Hymenobacter cavernae TaxID=2044852 RepID=A0ABQ1UXU6_9BACT|nr:hypothetical protein GCM10011383_45680 [Hymenobacter cavernae]